MNKKDKEVLPKAYRIYPFYHKLFYSCFMIVNRDNLSDYLIRKHYNYQDIPKIIDNSTTHNKREFFENIILDLEDAIDTVKNIKDSKRITQLAEHHSTKDNNSKKPIVIRISSEVDQKIKKIANKKGMKIGEVIEIAIAHHIENASNNYYDLIKIGIEALKDLSPK
ncbi:hypothetical protein [Gracilibacillus sp. YIM 98692]|uniref:hypothetical protein n=1 Tax=Gracilibacillus sp. YIM 98692 TaxID=2663532 RepID=UPI0013D74D83|nr:hypothetical protein [Gracilibacillus sp. YIM 98692]